MTHPLKRWPLLPTGTLNMARKPPSRVFDPHRRPWTSGRI
jgi:hypothetical protein